MAGVGRGFTAHDGLANAIGATREHGVDLVRGALGQRVDAIVESAIASIGSNYLTGQKIDLF
jgi:hypothetical protein